MVLNLPKERSHDKIVDKEGFAVAELDYIELKETGRGFGEDIKSRLRRHYTKHVLQWARPLWPKVLDEALEVEIPNLKDEKYANQFFANFVKLVDKPFVAKVLSNALGGSIEQFGWRGKQLVDFKPESQKMLAEALEKPDTRIWVTRVIDTSMKMTFGNIKKKNPESKLNIIYQSPRPLVVDLAPKESRAISWLPPWERADISDFSEIALLTAYRHLRIFAPTLVAASFISQVYETTHFFLLETPMTCRAHIVERKSGHAKMTFLRQAANTAVGLLAPGMLSIEGDLLFEKLRKEALPSEPDEPGFHELDFTKVLCQTSEYEEKIRARLEESLSKIPRAKLIKAEREDLINWNAIIGMNNTNALAKIYNKKWAESKQDKQSCEELVDELAREQEGMRKALGGYITMSERLLNRFGVEVDRIDDIL